MRIIETLPDIKRNRRSDRRKKEIAEFLKTDAKYGLIEFMSMKSAANERWAYQQTAKAIGCAESVKFHVRSGRLYIERV